MSGRTNHPAESTTPATAGGESPSPAKVPAGPQSTHDSTCKEPAQFIPPGVSFDTAAGRQAQGMDPDIGALKPQHADHERHEDEEGEKEDRAKH
ncbi:MAG TPA: hypothetical protein VF669_14150 [Tepidisphaeraceae bacterium]